MGGDTGNNIWTSIGKHYEEILKNQFPELIKQKQENFPDFKIDSFYLEAKVGNKKWGPHIKGFQKEFPNILDPVVYAFGFHEFDEAIKRLTHKTETWRQKYLKKNMQIIQTYFVSSSLVGKIYEKDKTISEKDKVEYCNFRSSHAMNLITNREFKRGGEKFVADSYYEFNRKDYLFLEAQDVNLTIPFKCGYIIDKKHKPIIEFLEKHLILKI